MPTETTPESFGIARVLLNATEVAESLDMLRSRVIRLANAERIPCVRLPDGEPRFLPEDIRAWVLEHRIPASNIANAKTNHLICKSCGAIIDQHLTTFS